MIGFDSFKIFEMIIVLGAPVLIASFFRSTFTRALDFAGVYANCFLFGILPPAMAYIQQSRKKLRCDQRFNLKLFVTQNQDKANN